MTDVHHPVHPHDLATLTPESLRDRFLVEGLFEPGELRWAFSQQDRLLVGGAMPAGGAIDLTAPEEVKAARLCDRREVGVVVLEGAGSVDVDGQSFAVEAEDIIYVGQGTETITVGGDAVYYLVSAPAHRPLPTSLARRAEAETHIIGEANKASLRTLRKYVHADGVASCELALGITTIEPGNVWNTMPCHTHDRRTEIYLYFGVPEGERVIHLCGEPNRTRSLVVADRQAVISPPWSIHTGAGTAPYRFVWSTAGENLAYDDMDHVSTNELA